MTATRSFSMAALLAGLACSSGPTVTYQKDGTACDAAACNNHGTCAYKDTHPVCTCAEGYAGLVCQGCAEGLHRASDDSCVADEVCTPTQCGDYGMCSVAAGRTTCACQAGYGGLLCDTCRAGHHKLEDGSCAQDESCLPTSCSGGGTCSVTTGKVHCACNANRSGSFCETHTATCAMANPCSATNGTCLDTDGIISCRCAPGAGGPTCATCYPGFRAAEDGSCVAADACAPSICSFAGTCTVTGGVASCGCESGYTGNHCDACAEGYHRGAGYRCVADEACTSDTCGTNGTCSVHNGVAECACHDGWAGQHCTNCYPGYHSSGADCVLDAECSATTCRLHGECSAANGAVSCACDSGFSGSRCETNADDCVNSACGDGTCVDLNDSNVCLCPNGHWGPSCEAL